MNETLAAFRYNDEYDSWGAEPKRPKIAALTTVYHKYSHAQPIVDRFLVPTSP